jgi:hypothetical protein
MSGFTFDAKAALQRAREARERPNLPNRPNRGALSAAGIGRLGSGPIDWSRSL